MIFFSLIVSLLVVAAAILFRKTKRVGWRIVIAICNLALLGWLLAPGAEYLFRSKTAILIDQLRGRGCQYQDIHFQDNHTVNPLTEWGIRNPDFACPMWAAGHLAAARGMSTAERDLVRKAFDEALQRKPDSYDTGDGVIEYGQALRVARETFRRAE